MTHSVASSASATRRGIAAPPPGAASCRRAFEGENAQEVLKVALRGRFGAAQYGVQPGAPPAHEQRRVFAPGRLQAAAPGEHRLRRFLPWGRRALVRWRRTVLPHARRGTP